MAWNVNKLHKMLINSIIIKRSMKGETVEFFDILRISMRHGLKEKELW